MAGTPQGGQPGMPNYATSPWVVAFVVCNFNTDLGPEVEFLYPSNVPFSPMDLTAMCFNSFPEQQNSETAVDLSFDFAITNNSPDVQFHSPQAPHGSASTFYGCCIFRQQFDDTMKRSFNQRTLVLLSNHTFQSFYHRLLQHMTKSGPISDPATVEAAYSQIAAWPPPAPGRNDLPFLGTVITLDIAPHYAFPLQGLAGPIPQISEKPLCLYAYEPFGSWDIIMPFFPCITDLYVLYEKLLLCESIVVIAQSPQLCSEAVSSLLDLIRPVPYAGEVRPYLTMQSDFRCIGIDGGTPRPYILGITNPFLLKRILSATAATKRARPHILYLQNYDGPVPAKRHHSLHRKSSRNALLDLPGGGIDAQAPSKRFLKSDPVFIEQVETFLKLNGQQQQPHQLDPLIRRFFAELTAQFLSPLTRFMATSVSADIDPSRRYTTYTSFSASEFLRDMAKNGTSVKFRGQGPIQRHRYKHGLYESFCESANFYSWLEMKIGLEREASVGLLGVSGGSSVSGKNG